MLHFECDYACGAMSEVMEALVKTNNMQTAGYGVDECCGVARALIKEKCGSDDIDVHFTVGGTQANLLVIAAALRPFEGVLCASTGHINVHETGAVEATGHKSLPLEHKDGKITAEQVRSAVLEHRADSSFEHMVRPAMVYISHPTELGTLYTLDELTALSDTCRELGIKLFVDGARLGYGIAALPEVDFAALTRLCDAFTIGGTKLGLLFGEAIVLTDPALRDCFRYHIKQRGAMLAKGRLLGVQFEAAMEGNLYVERAARANRFAQMIKQAFTDKGCEVFCDTITNQVFPIVPNAVLDKLGGKYSYSFWQKIDDARSAVRFCASVLTTEGETLELIGDIGRAFAE